MKKPLVEETVQTRTRWYRRMEIRVGVAVGFLAIFAYVLLLQFPQIVQLWGGECLTCNMQLPDSPQSFKRPVYIKEPAQNLCKIAALNPFKWCQHPEVARKCPAQCDCLLWMKGYMSEDDTGSMFN